MKSDEEARRKRLDGGGGGEEGERRNEEGWNFPSSMRLQCSKALPANGAQLGEGQA